jgi:hypothetical protein
MTKEDDEFDLDSTEPIKEVKLDLEVVRSKVPSYTSEKLCEMIVCERYFGFHPDVAVMCMEELAKRRIGGDNFSFEDYIENAFNALPKLEFKMPDLRSVLNSVAGQKFRK